MHLARKSYTAPVISTQKRLYGTSQSFVVFEPTCIRCTSRERAMQASSMSTAMTSAFERLGTLPHPPAAFAWAPAVVAAVLVVLSEIKRRKMTQKPSLAFQGTAFNKAVLSRMPVLRAPLKPLPFMANGHVETIVASYVRHKPNLQYRREYLLVPEGGVVALDWRIPAANDMPLADDAPVHILLPGLTGGSDDSYVRYTAQCTEAHGMRSVVFNSRGCGDTLLTTPQFYSALFIGDLEQVIAHVQQLYPRSRLFATGWSLGANILVNYLGSVGADTPLAAAASLCNPFNLTVSAANWEQGFNQIYDVNLAKAMRAMVARNAKVWNAAGVNFQVGKAANARTVRQWDEAITRVTFGLHLSVGEWCAGFDSVDDYYAASGSHQRVGSVAIPLLVVQADNDPIAPVAATPKQALLSNPNCILGVTKTGGHLGWVCSEGGYRGEPWTDRVVTEWFLSIQVQLSNAEYQGSLAGSTMTGQHVAAQTPQLRGTASTAAISSRQGAEVLAQQPRQQQHSSYTTARGERVPLPAAALRADEPDVMVQVGSPLANAKTVGRFAAAEQASSQGSVQQPAVDAVDEFSDDDDWDLDADVAVAERSSAQNGAQNGSSAHGHRYGATSQPAAPRQTLLSGAGAPAQENAHTNGTSAALTRRDSRNGASDQLPQDDGASKDVAAKDNVALHADSAKQQEHARGTSTHAHASSSGREQLRHRNNSGLSVASRGSQFWWGGSDAETI